LKEGSFWIQGTKIQPSNSKTLLGKHLKECVAIAYFQLQVNHQKEKRCEYFRRYLHYGQSYAPAAGGIRKKGHSGFKARKFSLLTQTLFFGKYLQECVAIAYFQLPINRKQEKRREFFCMCLHYGASYASETGGV
jgi:hypothetical protein